MVKKVVENIRAIIAVGSTILESARNEILWLLPPQMLIYSWQLGLTEKLRAVIEKGGQVRGITQISGTDVGVVRRLLDIGEGVRHVDEYRAEFMLVADKKLSVSSIPHQNINLEDLSLDYRVMACLTDDPSYVENLIATFEASWKEAIDAKQRLQELGV
jgi:hypothetical protein